MYNVQVIQVNNIAEWEHSAILSALIKLPFVSKIFVLSVFERPLNKRGFTIYRSKYCND